MNKIPQWVALEDEANRSHPLQVEPAVFRYMVQKGFPYAAQYQEARKAFDGLPYAAPDGNRYCSVIDDRNYSVVSAPVIGIGPPPETRNGLLLLAAHTHEAVIKRLVDDHASEEWAGRYFLNLGDWQIYTSHKKMVREALDCGFGHFTAGATLWVIRPGFVDQAKQQALVRLIEKYHRGHLISELLEAVRQAEANLREMLQRTCDQVQTGKDAWL